MNGPLKLIEEKVKGNNKVVHFGNFEKLTEIEAMDRIKLDFFENLEIWIVSP